MSICPCNSQLFIETTGEGALENQDVHKKRKAGCVQTALAQTCRTPGQWAALTTAKADLKVCKDSQGRAQLPFVWLQPFLFDLSFKRVAGHCECFLPSKHPQCFRVHHNFETNPRCFFMITAIYILPKKIWTVLQLRHSITRQPSTYVTDSNSLAGTQCLSGEKRDKYI